MVPFKMKVITRMMLKIIMNYFGDVVKGRPVYEVGGNQVSHFN